jgi:hypothetical protein
VDDHDTNNEQSFYTFLLEAKANPKCQIALSEVEINHKEKAFYYSARDVKWYENYPDVACHEALLSLAKEWDEDTDNHSCIAFLFVRIGENYDDLETRANDASDPDWLQVNRSISRDW